MSGTPNTQIQSNFTNTLKLKSMKTTINNNERIFLLIGDMGQTLICNIEDLRKCYNQFADKDELIIQHKWNARFIKCSKKSIVDMLKSLGLDHGFISNEYKFKFNGRKVGAIGKTYPCKMTVKATNLTAAERKIYDQYELITNLKQY